MPAGVGRPGEGIERWAAKDRRLMQPDTKRINFRSRSGRNGADADADADADAQDQGNDAPQTRRNTKTPAELKAASARREEQTAKELEELQASYKVIEAEVDRLHGLFPHHTRRHFRAKITRQSKATGTRKISSWQAYLSAKAHEYNDALPPGGSKRKIDDIAKELRPIWDAMTEQEREDATEFISPVLEERREHKRTAAHNVPMGVFNDVKATLTHCEQELVNLWHRTGTEVLLLAVRCSEEDYLMPRSFVTTSKVEDYIQMLIGMNTTKLGAKIESYVLAGVEGAKKSNMEDIAALRSTISKHIKDALSDIARPRDIDRVNYKGFDTAVTEKLGIICVNWPFKVFQNPGMFGSRVELEILYRCWKSGFTHFKKLSRDELEDWKQKRFEARVAGDPMPTGVIYASSPSFPDILDTSQSIASTSTALPDVAATPTGRSESATDNDTLYDPADDPYLPGDISVPPDNANVSGSGVELTAGDKRPFITVFAADSGMTTGQKQRKKRCDAGVKRGPNSRTRKAS